VFGIFVDWAPSHSTSTRHSHALIVIDVGASMPELEKELAAASAGDMNGA
jgi:hypothetical protein